MKSIAQLIGLGLIASLLSSCCWFACDKPAYKEVSETKYKTVKNVVDAGDGAKGGVAYATEEKVPYTVTKKVKIDKCGDCGSTFCPKPGCCGTVGEAVLKRATAQGASGEPHIGLIPTMKVLAE